MSHKKSKEIKPVVLEIWGPDEYESKLITEKWAKYERYDSVKERESNIKIWEKYDKKINDLSIMMKTFFNERGVSDQIDNDSGVIIPQVIGDKRISILDTLGYLDARIDELQTQLNNIPGTIQQIVKSMEEVKESNKKLACYFADYVKRTEVVIESITNEIVNLKKEVNNKNGM